MLGKDFRKVSEGLAYRMGRKLGGAGFSPNSLTALTLLMGLASAYLIYLGQLLYAVLFILLSGFTDLLDGAVARATGRVTKWGAMCDSVTDKVTEMAIYFALALYSPALYVGATLAIATFMLSSYISKHAGAIGAKQGGGLLERKERILLIIAGLILIDYMAYILYIIAALSALTAVQRLYRTNKILRVG